MGQKPGRLCPYCGGKFKVIGSRRRILYKQDGSCIFGSKKTLLHGRSINASILKVEKELEKLFDHVDVDCLEIELGMLVRRRKEAGYEWLIEI